MSVIWCLPIHRQTQTSWSGDLLGVALDHIRNTWVRGFAKRTLNTVRKSEAKHTVSKICHPSHLDVWVTDLPRPVTQVSSLPERTWKRWKKFNFLTMQRWSLETGSLDYMFISWIIAHCSSVPCTQFHTVLSSSYVHNTVPCSQSHLIFAKLRTWQVTLLPIILADLVNTMVHTVTHGRSDCDTQCSTVRRWWQQNASLVLIGWFLICCGQLCPVCRVWIRGSRFRCWNVSLVGWRADFWTTSHGVRSRWQRADVWWRTTEPVTGRAHQVTAELCSPPQKNESIEISRGWRCYLRGYWALRGRVFFCVLHTF